MKVVFEAPQVLELGKSVSGHLVVRTKAGECLYGITITVATRKTNRAGRELARFTEEKPLSILEPGAYVQPGEMRVAFTIPSDAFPPVPTYIGASISVRHVMIACVACRGWLGRRSVRTFTHGVVVQHLVEAPSSSVEPSKRAWLTVNDYGHCKLELQGPDELDVDDSLRGTLEARLTRRLRRISLALLVAEDEEPLHEVHRWTLWEAFSSGDSTGLLDAPLVRHIDLSLKDLRVQPSVVARVGATNVKVCIKSNALARAGAHFLRTLAQTHSQSMQPS